MPDNESQVYYVFADIVHYLIIVHTVISTGLLYCQIAVTVCLALCESFKFVKYDY